MCVCPIHTQYELLRRNWFANEEENQLNFINNQYESILVIFKKFEEENASLKLKNTALKRKLEMAVSKLNEHEMCLDELEQYQRRDCVEIKGIPLTENENTSDLSFKSPICLI